MTAAPRRRRSTDAIAYIAAELFSSAGNASSLLVVPWLVLASDDDVVVATGVMVCIAVAGLVGGLSAPRVIARLGRRAGSIVADATAATGAVVLGVALSLGEAVLPGAFFVAGVLLGLGDVPGATAKQALLADVAREAEIDAARLSGVRYIAYVVAWIGAPLGVGIGLTVAPEAMIFVVAFFHSAASACFLVLDATDVASSGARSRTTGIRDAWRRIRADTALRTAAVCQATSTALSLPLTSLYLVSVAADSDSGAFLGVSFALLALGVLAGNVAYLVLHRPRRRRAMMWVSLTCGTIGFLGLVLLPAAMAGFLVLLGLALGLLAPLWAVIPAERLPLDARADVLALQNTAALGSGPVAVALVGQAIAVAGTGAGAIVLSAIWVVSAAFLVATRAPSRLA